MFWVFQCCCDGMLCHGTKVSVSIPVSGGNSHDHWQSISAMRLLVCAHVQDALHRSCKGGSSMSYLVVYWVAK